MVQRLKLTKPLVVFDLETTGANVYRDRIVEFAAVTLHPDGRRERFVTRVNPEMPIPAEATRVHGISDADVKDAPTFDQVAPRIVELMRDADVGGFNVARFDLPLLARELERVGVEQERKPRYIADSQVIFHRMEPRDLSAALRYYCDRELTGAHGALADAEAALDVLLAQVERYTEGDKVLPDDMASIDAISQRRDENFVDPEGRLRWDGDEVVIGFGKHRGTQLRELAQSAPDYLEWILRKDFSPEVKAVIEGASRGEFPTRS